VRTAALLALALVTACGPTPITVKQKPSDPTTERWYTEGVAQLNETDRKAQDFFKHGKQDEAAALIENGEKLSARLLSVPQPTLQAMEAASDLDQLYGEMLLSNGNYGWARIMFQKNTARWKYWRPQTEETAKRLKKAEAAIAECDRRLSQ
jgi:hypothetical protein